jgi:UDP-sugar pyrophosphorylase
LKIKIKMKQLADLDTSYPGGLAAYLSKAKQLLKESADGTNPFDEYTAVVPTGEVLSYNSKPDDKSTTMTFAEAEEIGLNASSNIVFCLVAGGLGERLGYSGIKLSLPTDLCTDECYLALYAKYILALQYRARVKLNSPNLQIPLVIMTSGDTDTATRQLLEQNSYFGFSNEQVTVVMQDKVAALSNGNAGLALEDDDRWCIQTKPHGHGDVHHLLFREGLVDQWEKEGKSHVVFLQDTNALVINSVLPTLGVSIQKGFHMNSICIPRLAGEAAGAITRLE